LSIPVISQDSTATYLRCGETYSKAVVGDFFLFQTEQKFGK